jgi:DNA helicase-2/ATP-dependent DNA helicase PcrA
VPPRRVLQRWSRPPTGARAASTTSNRQRGTPCGTKETRRSWPGRAGAGKTEFLAQRAAYLLETGICPWPQRILAISFKRDAAANLGRRVTARVPDHADRFVSMTFDAFTKGLVDRFASALPEGWRMKNGYEIDFPSERYIEGFLGDVGPAAPAAIRS